MSFDSTVDTDHDEKLYEEYLLWCRANDLRPSPSGYQVWQGDLDITHG